MDPTGITPAITAIASVSVALTSWVQALIQLEDSQKPKGFTKEAQAHMDQLKELLIPLEKTGLYLKEAKQFHDHLNRLTPHFSSLISLFHKALIGGTFSPDDYSLGDFAERWNGCNKDYIELMHFLTEEMKYIAPPLRVNEKNNSCEGEEWLKKFFTSRDKINAFKKKREDAMPVEKQDLADEINSLHNAWMTATTRANGMIRNIAADISEGFLILGKTLKR